MDGYSLELTLTATEGAVHNLGTLICLAWVSASTYNPLHRDRGRAVVLTRPDGSYGELEANEWAVSTEPLGEVVALMRHLGLPQRMPRVQARKGNPSGWQELVLDLALDSQRCRLSFGLEYAGLEGDDAGSCLDMLSRLFDLLGIAYLGRWVAPG